MSRSRLARCGLVLAAVTATVVGLAAPAQAFPQASFHTLSTGNRGVDVLAAQYLLQARGISVAADGVFGSGTAAAVRSLPGRQRPGPGRRGRRPDLGCAGADRAAGLHRPGGPRGAGRS